MHSILISRALEVSAKAHEGQYRKSDGRIPYISHCAAVGVILLRAGYDETVVAAGILHDVLEDTILTHDDLRSEFGEEVLELVDLVTEQDKSVPWDERKTLYEERLVGAMEGARAIAAADKLHNVWSLLESLRRGEPIFARMNKGPTGQIAQWERVIAVLSDGWESQLLDDLRELIGAVKMELESGA